MKFPKVNILETNEKYEINDKTKLSKDYFYSLDMFEGETDEDKLHSALDSVQYGTIICKNEIELTKQYNSKNKDYRYVNIFGGKFILNVDNWFSFNNDGYCPQFISCTFDSTSTYNLFSADKPLIGLRFDNCYIKNLRVYHSQTNFIQSLYMTNTTMYNNYDFITCKNSYNIVLDDCRFESGQGKFITTTTDTSVFGITNMSITNCLFEGRTNTFLHTGTISNLNFTGNYMEYNKCGNFIYVYTVGGYNTMNVIGNSFFEVNNDADYHFIEFANYGNTQMCIKFENNCVQIPSNLTYFIGASSVSSGNYTFSPASNYVNYGYSKIWRSSRVTTFSINNATGTTGNYKIPIKDSATYNAGATYLLTIFHGFSGSTAYNLSTTYIVSACQVYDSDKTTVVPKILYNSIASFEGNTGLSESDIIDSITYNTTSLSSAIDVVINLKNICVSHCTYTLVPLRWTFTLQ